MWIKWNQISSWLSQLPRREIITKVRQPQYPLHSPDLTTPMWTILFYSFLSPYLMTPLIPREELFSHSLPDDFLEPHGSISFPLPTWWLHWSPCKYYFPSPYLMTPLSPREVIFFLSLPDNHYVPQEVLFFLSLPDNPRMTSQKYVVLSPYVTTPMLTPDVFVPLPTWRPPCDPRKPSSQWSSRSGQLRWSRTWWCSRGNHSRCVCHQTADRWQRPGARSVSSHSHQRMSTTTSCHMRITDHSGCQVRQRSTDDQER